MDLRAFLRHEGGEGFLATINAKGEIDVVPAARPRKEGEGVLRFERIDLPSYRNLAKNPRATYIYDAGGLQGIRLYLEKTGEEPGGPQRDPVRARAEALTGTSGPNRHVVYFRILRHAPLASADWVG